MRNRGLIKLLLIIIVAVIVLGYFKIDLRTVIESEPVQRNFDYLWGTASSTWANLTK